MFSPPAGFLADDGRGPFTRHNGPVYRKDDGSVVEVGLHVLDRHCNGMGFLHGGMISAFADGALAWAVWREARRSSVTVQLSLDFLDIVRLGDWLVARPVHVATTEDVVHVEADLIRNDDILAAHAVGVFQLLRQKAK